MPAATWTQASNTFTAPAGAYQYSFNPTLGGTPASSQIFYLDVAIAYPTFIGQQLASVAQVTYDSATYPAVDPTHPTGMTVLA